MEDLKSRIKNYIIKEISIVGKPKNPNQTYRFKNIETIIDLLFSLLDVQIKEKTLQRVKNNFYTHVPKILDFNETELPTAIEGLATNFEPFLKLIAYLKYGETDLWEPNDEHCAGLTQTMLFNLLSGKISNKHSSPPEIELIDIPEPIIKYKGFQRTIVDFVRTDLRNAVHNAKLYSRIELMHYSNIVISCYLFAIEDNTLYLKKKFYNEFHYLQRVFDDKNFENLDKVYVELLGEEDFKDIEVYGLELIDEVDLLESIEGFKNLSNDFEHNDLIEENVKERRVDSIIEIANDTPHLEIIGQPGSGKSTTLLKILFNNSQRILQGETSLKIPFFINANEYRPDNTFLDILSTNISHEWITEKLNLGNIQILIDGVNEISEKYKNEAYAEINHFLTAYPQNSIIISERKVNFERRFNIPVFELKDLNETQIKSFINNYAGKYYDKIWNQLKHNEDMLKLAYSPLMLKMILTVSKHGNIPHNRGLLYQTFLNSIFHREKIKQEQVRTDTKQDVLSHIAFEMRKAGYVSLSISKFKKLIEEKLDKLNSPIPLNLIYTEFQDNLIINESYSENVTFFHETYQEYFCAIELKNIYESIGEFDFNFNDKAWYESILICSELIKDSKRAISFFTYLYKGQNSSHTQKTINSFDTTDFNENINIACKVAFSLKTLRPEVYQLAEKYLSNYLIIWKKILLEKKTSALPVEILFASVASLNSPKIIKHIFNHLGWVYFWLFSEYEDVNNTTILQNIDKAKKEQVRKILNEICLNTPNFAIFYNVINDSLNKSHFSKSIYWRLNYLKLNLLKNQTENQLRQYYNSNPDFSVFLAMLRNDINAINEYSFSDNGESKNSEVLKTIINYHISKEVAQNVLLKELLTSNYDDNLIHKTIDKLFEINQLEKLFIILEFFFDNKVEIYKKHIQKLQVIPFALLSEKLKGQFIKFENNDLIPYQIVQKNKLLINKKFFNHFMLDGHYSLNKEFEIKVIDISPKTVQGKRTAIISNDNINPDEKISNIGELIVKSNNKRIVLDYSDYRITKKGDKWEFGLINFNETEWLVDLKDSNYKISVNQIEDWNFHQWAFKQIEDKEYFYVKFEIPPSVGKNPYFPESGNISLSNSNISVNSATRYHPSILVSNRKIMSKLKQSIKEPEYVSFITKLGLAAHFHKEINKVHYGIIVQVYENCLRIYSLRNQKFIDYKIFHDDVSRYETERIVVIENNYKINLVSEKDEYIDKVGYLKSEIIWVDEIKQEGFIYKKTCLNNTNESDYFFHFKSCNFSPEKGDSVKFIPAINPSKNHANEPIALKIYKITPNKCKILHSGYNYNKTHIVGKAIDLKTEELVFFRLNPEYLKYIKNLDTTINENQIFEYRVIKEKKEELLKLIKLTKLIEQYNY